MPRIPSAVYEGLENSTVKKKKSKGDRTAAPLSPVASKRFAVDKPPQTSKVDLNDFLKKCEGGQAEEENSKPSGDIDAPTLNPARSDGGDEEWRKSRSFADSSGSDTG